MPSLNLSLDFFDHPKTLRLVGALGSGAESCLLRLWCYTGKFHFQDGVLQGYDDLTIENICRWHGEKGALVRVLVAVKFLDTISGGFSVHDWKTHASHFLYYHQKSIKMNKLRWKHRSSSKESNKDSVKDSTVDSQGSAVQGSARQGKKKEGGVSQDRDRERFQPPTIDEVSIYCAERRNQVDASAFVNFYQSKGWKVGFQPMKDWKSAVITWEKKDGIKSGGSNGMKTLPPSHSVTL